MARFVSIDLTGMDPPDVIETLDYEDILAELKEDASDRMEELGLTFDVADLESDPAVKILEVAAYREVVLRARVNGAAKALLLALSKKMDLEHLGAWFGVERAVVTEATSEDEEDVMEEDDRLRTRVQLAPQAFSTAGPVGAYEFHTLTAAPTVKSVVVTNPMPGYVNIYPLVDTGDGTPSDEVLNDIRAWLQDEAVVPLTDIVSVARPVIQKVDVNVTLIVKRGPDAATLRASAKDSIQDYADARHKVGSILRQSGIYAAAQITGVDSVIINAPTADVDPGEHGAVYVKSITVDHKVLT